MREIFVSGDDYHARTAELIAPKMWKITDWNALSDAEKKRKRSSAKAVNFGLVYGKGAASLAKDMGCTVAEAEAVVAAILGSFGKAAKWMTSQLRFAQKYGGIWVEWPRGHNARWRPLTDIAGQDGGKKSTAQNGAVNTPVQGHASDICLTGLIRLVHWIRRNNLPIRIVLTVYDSIIFEVPHKLVPRLYHMSRKLMEEGFDLNGVPLVSDPEIGDRWGSPFKMKHDDSGIYVWADDSWQSLTAFLKNS